MHFYSRRDLGRMLMALPLAAPSQRPPAPVYEINGVRMGLETFSFHDLPPSGDPRLVPTIVANMREIGLAECEIMSGHVEPFPSVATGWWVQSRRAPGYEEMRERARRWQRRQRDRTNRAGGEAQPPDRS
jgi:hypothetical protein